MKDIRIIYIATGVGMEHYINTLNSIVDDVVYVPLEGEQYPDTTTLPHEPYPDYIEMFDAKPTPEKINNDSWQKLNRGKLSKKDRRKQ